MRTFLLCLSLALLAARANAQAGSLDPSFGTSGLVQASINLNSYGRSVAMQADGRIVVGAISGSAAIVVRYMPDGTMDTGFGTDGIVTLPHPNGQMTTVLIQPDGKILTLGITAAGPVEGDAFVTRLTASGAIDASFGVAGTAIIDDGGADFAWDMVIRPEGGIVVLEGSSIGGVSHVMMAAFTPEGLPDGSFSEDGKYRFDVATSNSQYPQGLALQSDGKLIAAGYYDVPLEHYRFACRVNTDGTLDESFGTGGVATLNATTIGLEEAMDVQVDTSDNILVIGSLEFTGLHHNAIVTKLLPDGAVDASYGTAGTATCPDPGWTLHTTQSCLQADGKLVLSANRFGDFNLIYNMAYRLNTDGTMDNTFGTGGVVDNAIPSGQTSNATAMTLQADGKLVLCGSVGQQLALARLIMTGTSGITENGGTMEAAAHPVPATDAITVTCADASARATISILEPAGRVVMLPRSFRNTATLDISGLTQGAYVIRITDSERSSVLRFVKD